MTRITSDLGRYAIVPEWLLDAEVSANAIRLWAVLAAKYADRSTDTAHPGRTRLAADMHKSVDTVDRATRELIDCGAIEVEARWSEDGDQETNAYRLHFSRPGVGNGADTPLGTDAPTRVGNGAAQSIITSDPESSDPEVSLGGSILAACKMVEQALGTLSKREIEWVTHEVGRGFSEDEIGYALDEARRNSAMNVRYCEGVLRNREPGFLVAMEHRPKNIATAQLGAKVPFTARPATTFEEVEERRARREAL